MSVIQSKRNIAESEYITTMRELHRYTFEKCKKFPKSQTFYYGESIRKAADALMIAVLGADSVKMTNRHEAQRRIDYISNAFSACDMLDSLVETAKKPCAIPVKHIQGWGALIGREESLLSGQMEFCKKKLREFSKQQ